jgi:flagellar protein FliL
MPDKKPESAPAAPTATPAATEAGTPPAETGALARWWPLMVTIVVMPVLAFATTRFVLLPQLRKGLETPAPDSATAAQEAKSHGRSEAGAKTARGKVRSTVALNKMIVNVAGTMGTRYLLASITLAGTTPDFKTRIEESNDQLLDLATATLSTKTIPDLEKPGARNEIRTELLATLNSALGESLIQEIFITELAIQ